VTVCPEAPVPLLMELFGSEVIARPWASAPAPVVAWPACCPSGPRCWGLSYSPARPVESGCKSATSLIKRQTETPSFGRASGFVMRPFGPADA
jgi:hypothetical protein